MALYIKDDKIDDLVRRYQAAIQAPSKTEALRLALQHALDNQQTQPVLADIAVKFCRALRSKGNYQKRLPADKQIIDGLFD